MKITKFIHSCLLVEIPDRVALFDPGMMSGVALRIEALSRLDDIFITHGHGDHVSVPLVKQLVAKFPQVRITTTNQVVEQLRAEGIAAGNTPPEGVTLFNSPHEEVRPLYDYPEEIGVHYLDLLSHPGDSHSFTETKPILAMPVTAPWGSAVRAIQLALELKPRYVLPIHDWHWSDEARQAMYDDMERVMGQMGITFMKLETGQPVELNP
jgi:L-ascorbate metabolism protein UlaG (beta-lactamase superfamily)